MVKNLWYKEGQIEKDRKRFQDRNQSLTIFMGIPEIVTSALKQPIVYPGCNFSLKQWGTSNQIKKEFICPLVTIWVVFSRKWKKEFKASGEKVVSLSHFYEIWRSHFSEFKNPRVSCCLF